MRVGLIGSPEREELQRLAIRLEERDAEPVLLDVRGDPRFALTGSSLEACGVELTRLGACYVADLGLLPSGAGGGDPQADARALCASQRRLVLWTTVLARLALRARVVNPPRTWDLHGLKPFESAAYARAGIPVPRSVATTDPRALLELPALAAGWITKGLVGGYGYTELFAPPEDEAQARAALAAGPRLVQERVRGENVRAFVVGGRLVGAAEIVPASGAEVDSRRDTGRVGRVVLSEQARAHALAAAKRFGLAFAAVDLMRAAGGRHVVLECNSAPFFVEFERHTGIDVSSALADLLTERVRRSPAPS